MKKSIFMALSIGFFCFVSCSKSDDKKALQDCQTCNLDILGEMISSEFCDNGDGTFTITSNGESETQDLDGATFQQFIDAYEQFGATCN